jgi:hypothetical protein
VERRAAPASAAATFARIAYCHGTTPRIGARRHAGGEGPWPLQRPASRR